MVHEELEAQLRDDPDDRAAWTVYGDWLLEHGDRRGQLVRGGREPTAEELAAWCAPLPARLVSGWRHGFPIELELPCHPRATELLAAVLAHPAHRLVSSVILRRYTYRDDDGLPEAAHPERDPVLDVLACDLRRLRALAIRYVPLSDDQVAALAAAPLAITALDLRYSGLTDDRLARLAEAPWFSRLRRLHLHHTALTAASAATLARPFELVDVRGTGIEPAALPARRVVPAGTAASLAGERARAPVPPRLADGLALSPVRTARFTTPRVLDKRSLSRTFTKDCARVPGMRDHVVVYVDPAEWSFRTYEHVLPLDRLCPTTDLELADHVELAHELHRFTLRGALPAFDELPLYGEPLNAASRGGQRYIFHAAPLADALTRAIRTSALRDLPGFSHVNPVFRCNRFEPGDAPFHRHLDTPYHDAARGQISQYTLLIYLTGGTGDPALEIEGLRIDAIDAMQAFVFHQAYAHAGAPFADARKVFLRSELVFGGVDVAHDPRIAALFSKACYLTGESTRDAELARDADRAYHAVAAAHWRAALPPPSEPFLHKQFRGIHWLANGYDFWFPNTLPLADCAAVVLLDYFNCKLGEAAFRSLVEAAVVRDVDPEAFVAGLPAPPPLPALDKQALFPPPEAELTCCPGHAGAGWRASLSVDVIELYRRAQAFCRARIEPAPIVMLGQEVFLDPSRFQITGNQIHVLSSTRLAPVNFAACWNCPSDPPNYLDVERVASVVQPLVPPILWEATPATHHLMFDFFRNGWAVSESSYEVPIPEIRHVDPEIVEPSDLPWLDRARTCAVVEGRPPVQTPFWSSEDGSPLIRELYADRPRRR